MTTDSLDSLKKSMQFWSDIFRLMNDLNTTSKLALRTIYQKRRFSDLQTSHIRPLLGETILHLEEIRKHIDAHRVSPPSDTVTALKTSTPSSPETCSQATVPHSRFLGSDVPTNTPLSKSDKWFSQLEPEE